MRTNRSCHCFFTEMRGNVLRMDISQKNILIMPCKSTTFCSFPQSLYLGILVSNNILSVVNLSSLLAISHDLHTKSKNRPTIGGSRANMISLLTEYRAESSFIFWRKYSEGCR